MHCRQDTRFPKFRGRKFQAELLVDIPAGPGLATDTSPYGQTLVTRRAGVQPAGVSKTPAPYIIAIPIRSRWKWAPNILNYLR